MTQNFPLLTAVWVHNRARIVVIIILLLCVLGAYAAQRWVAEPHLLALRTEQSRLQQHVRQRQMEFANSGVPVSTAEQIEKNLQQFDHLIPEQTDLSAFLGELFDWSQQAGLDIRQINFQPEMEKESGLLRYGLSFSVNGSYAQVKQFIHLLENARRILLVEKIALSGSSTTNKGRDNVALRIELATYFQEGSS
ncbi:MAG: type 4a pilus biogenesis protein PilO [Deltaproteobacteria bacterium]|nr:type 4a pilus biogenesis protein PilO [Deltaproteobacteria bacterium]